MGWKTGCAARSARPAYPTAGGGIRSSDGRLWFTTGRGLAVLNPDAQKPVAFPPAAHLVQMTANGDPVDLSRAARLAPGDERLQIRYTGIHLSAPERVQYFYKLEGLDTDWVTAGGRRVINYNSLHHGHYRFMRARGTARRAWQPKQSYEFEILPQLLGYCLVPCILPGEQPWPRLGRSISFGCVRSVRGLRWSWRSAPGWRGKSTTRWRRALSASPRSWTRSPCACLKNATPARSYLDMARRMARHSLTEARRSVMDLRASALDGQDLAAAIESGTRLWTAGSGVEVAVEVTGTGTKLPEEMEQHLLRIAQEAVTNALKHAGASRIGVSLHLEARNLHLRIGDNGRGFDRQDVFSSRAGHFGLIGMRERAERLGGELRLESHPGAGTEVEVTVPLP